MKSILLLTLTICMSSLSFAQKQKVEIDGDTIKVDGVSYAIILKQKPAAPIYTIKSMSGVLLMNWQFLDFNDPREVSKSNTKGRVTYFQVTFFNDKQQCEIQPPFGTQKAIAKCILENDLIKDGAINQEAENNFVLVNGKKFSEQQQSSGGYR